MVTGENDDAASIREDSFLAGLVPQVEEHLAEQHAGDFDAEAGRARFLSWLTAHAEEPASRAGSQVAPDDFVISFDNVTKVYPDQRRAALDGVDLAVRRGEFVFFFGPPGSGKSTLLRLIMKEEQQTEGRIHVAGKDLARLKNREVPHLHRRIGCIFQDFRLLHLPGLPVAARQERLPEHCVRARGHR